MIETIELAAGVTLLAVQTEKFKSGCFSFNLMRPHTKAAAPLDALLPSVLLRGSERWPDMRAISMRLDELYGATLGTLVRLRGETKLTGFYADFIEEAFLPAGEAVFAPMVEFFRDILFHPALENGLLNARYVESEKQNLIHAIESSLSPKANPITKLFGYRAIEMILKGYQAIQKDGPDARLPLLGDFLLASNFVGIAFGNAGCAAVHALAYPLGAVYHVPHGESNYAVFTGVMNQYMRLKTDGAIAELNQFMANILGCEVANLYAALEGLLGCLIPKKSLREYGMTEAEIETFADSVVENQQRLLANNFVPLKRDQIRDIYRAIH